jgi:tRNA(Ile)-lysidine synthase
VSQAAEGLYRAFSTAMDRLAPFEPSPRIAAGVSGGADSMALALLANGWVRQRGGSLLALIVDHRLRPESGTEATEAAARLVQSGINARVLPLQGLEHGSALAERAREARISALVRACADRGILHLLLGHHAADQAETVLIRSLSGSGPAGLAGMAPLVELAAVRILRPLLAVPPVDLRQYLRGTGVEWVDDPSNRDRSALRPRLRMLRSDEDGTGAATRALVGAAGVSARQRADVERGIAGELAERVSLWPEGFALLDGPISAAAFAALLQTISGASYPPASDTAARIAAAFEPATLSGARLLRAGRLGSGRLLVREAAAMAAPVIARPGAVWDRRFRLGEDFSASEQATVGPLGDDTPKLRRLSRLPSVILRTLPAIRVASKLLAVPHLRYPDAKTCEAMPVMFAPPRPAAVAPYRFGDVCGATTPYVGETSC